VSSGEGVRPSMSAMLNALALTAHARRNARRSTFTGKAQPEAWVQQAREWAYDDREVINPCPALLALRA